jgi:hypothetical protein
MSRPSLETNAVAVAMGEAVMKHHDSRRTSTALVGYAVLGWAICGGTIALGRLINDN